MKKKGRGLILLGLLLIVAAFFLTAYNLYDGLRAKRSVNETVIRLNELLPTDVPSKTDFADVPSGADLPDSTEIPGYVLDSDVEMPVEVLGSIEYIGVLRIPTLGLELPVISGWSYPNLKIAPCRYEGSAYLDNLVIAAHNYQSHFGMLKNLFQGDEVTFTDVDGNVFRYEVAVLETLAPTSVEEMTSGDYDLTLFTCTLSGTSRVTVRCDRIKEDISL